jgi:hypothetical protein
MHKVANKRLFEAIENDDRDTLFRILDSDGDALEALGEHSPHVLDKTPLMWALQCANFPLVHALLDRGANAAAVMPGGPRHSVLRMCVYFAYCDDYRHDEWIRVATRLLDGGADPTYALWPALGSFGSLVKRTDLIRLLLARGANPDQMVGNSGNTARELVECNRRLFTDEVLLLFNLETHASRPEPEIPLPPAKANSISHPSGDFETVLEAMAFAIKTLRGLSEWNEGVDFTAQGMGSRTDTYHFATIHIRQDELKVNKSVNIDPALVTKLALVPEICLQKKGDVFSIAEATAEQAACVLDVIYRRHLGIRPHTGEGDDYAFDVEW